MWPPRQASKLLHEVSNDIRELATLHCIMHNTAMQLDTSAEAACLAQSAQLTVQLLACSTDGTSYMWGWKTGGGGHLWRRYVINYLP